MFENLQLPELTHPFLDDPAFQLFFQSMAPPSHKDQWQSELKSLGDKVRAEAEPLSVRAEQNPPRHIPFNPWGERVDQIAVDPAWDELKDFSAREGLVAEAFERNFGPHSRLLQFFKLYQFHSSSAFFSCPLAMTDGAARVLEVHGTETQHSSALRHLTSRSSEEFWTSGQWMTEKAGGSDVSLTETVARPVSDHEFELSGLKWFSSATTGEMALALARIEGAEAGSRGLSLFQVPVRNDEGQLNGIEVLRLKDKLGTKALPTAELKLLKTKAFLVGAPNKGVRTVASMLNITRLYNSVCSISQARRAIERARAFSEVRVVFGEKLKDKRLFQQVLADGEWDLWVHSALTFYVADLLGKDESGEATNEEKSLLRILTPVTKMSTAKMSVRVCSEMLEAFGGTGYVEDSGIPKLLRDAQVFPIWEGATQVMSLDLLRVIEKEQSLETSFKKMKELSSLNSVFSQALLKQIEKLEEEIPQLSQDPLGFIREFGLSFANLFGASLLSSYSSGPGLCPELSQTFDIHLSNKRRLIGSLAL